MGPKHVPRTHTFLSSSLIIRQCGSLCTFCNEAIIPKIVTGSESRHICQSMKQLVERFFDINMTKTGLSYFLTGDTKNAHCALCVFDKYARFSQIRSQLMVNSDAICLKANLGLTQAHPEYTRNRKRCIYIYIYIYIFVRDLA